MKRVVGIVAVLMFFVSPFYLFAQTANNSAIPTIAEQMPEYPGGLDSLMKEIALRVIYPKQCSDSNIQGKVFIHFIINENGSISNTEVIKSPHPLLSAAAVEAVKTLGKFKPAMDKGKVIKVWYSLPVSFKIKLAVQPAVPLPSELTKVTDPALLDTLNKQVKEDEKLFTFVEQGPEFPGGDGELMHFLMRNIQYPLYERDNDIQGKVLTRFVVMEDGSITDIQVIKGLSPGLDQEAIHVVSLLPKFKPATQQGKAVRVYFNLPILFKLYNSGDVINNSKRRVDLFDYYPGDYDAFSKLINENIIYPSAAASNKIEAAILVKCRVNENLKIEPIEVINDIDSMFSSEAIRVIRMAAPLSDKVKTSEAIKETRTIEIVFTFDKRHQWKGSGLQDKSSAQRFLTEGADYFKQTKYDKALEHFDAAIRYYSIYADAFYNRAATKLKMNDKVGACDDFRRAYLLGALDAIDAAKQTCK